MLLEKSRPHNDMINTMPGIKMGANWTSVRLRKADSIKRWSLVQVSYSQADT